MKAAPKTADRIVGGGSGSFGQYVAVALSARMAVLHRRGIMARGQTLQAHSIIGSTFTGRIADLATVGSKQAIIPEISGRAWITGTHQHMLDPSDPFPQGYRLTDTWGCG